MKFCIGLFLTLIFATNLAFAGYPAPIIPPPTSITAFVDAYVSGPVNTPTTVKSVKEFETVFGTLGNNREPGRQIALFFHNGGTQAIIVRATDQTVMPARLNLQQIIGDAHSHTGMHALDGVPIFNLLILRPLVGLHHADAAEGYVEAMHYANERHAFVLVDPPTEESVIDWLKGHHELRQPDGAVFFPYLIVNTGSPSPEPTGLMATVPASGAIAGKFAQIDQKLGVWKAAAGASDGQISGFDRLSVDLTDKDVDKLSPLAVNPLRRLNGYGDVIYGAKTLSTNQEGSVDQFIPVKRTAAFLENSIQSGSQWISLEPSNQKLWREIHTWVDQFLASLEKRGAFYNYVIVCDSSNNTVTDSAQGRVNLTVEFAPVDPTKFTFVNLTFRSAVPTR
jgi:phage tail sheath protein FI